MYCVYTKDKVEWNIASCRFRQTYRSFFWKLHYNKFFFRKISWIFWECSRLLSSLSSIPRYLSNGLSHVSCGFPVCSDILKGQRLWALLSSVISLDLEREIVEWTPWCTFGHSNFLKHFVFCSFQSHPTFPFIFVRERPKNDYGSLRRVFMPFVGTLWPRTQISFSSIFWSGILVYCF